MKPRRDITLGEMQDECRRRNAFCGYIGACPYRDFCHETVGDKCGWGDKGPRDWNLTDPPRFTEAQMALLKAWRDAGAMAAQLTHDVAGMDSIFFYSFSKPLQIEYCMGFVKNSKVLVGLDFNGEILDLAELLGKDGESK